MGMKLCSPVGLAPILPSGPPSVEKTIQDPSSFQSRCCVQLIKTWQKPYQHAVLAGLCGCCEQQQLAESGPGSHGDVSDGGARHVG